MSDRPVIVTCGWKEGEQVLGRLAKKLTKRGIFTDVIRMALNETIDHAQTLANKAIREEYAASQEDVRRTMRVWYASNLKLTARLSTRGKACLELIKYRATKQVNGVSVKVLKSSRKSLIKATENNKILLTQRKERARVWIAKGHVMAMKKNKNTPIILYGPSFLTRLSHNDVRLKIIDGSSAYYQKRIKHHAKHCLANGVSPSRYQSRR